MSKRAAKIIPAKTYSAVSPVRAQQSMRQRFNPVRGLTPAKLARSFDAWALGHLRDGALIFEEMIERDAALQSAVPERLDAMESAEWEILTVEDSAAAKQQREALLYFYNNATCSNAEDEDERGGMQKVFRQMTLAQMMRWNVHELIWQPRAEGLTCEFRQVPLRWFERTTGKLRFLESEFAQTGTDMAAGEWMVTKGSGVMKACAILFLFKHLPLKDWLVFCEKFAVPFVLGKTNAAKGSTEWDQMVAAISNFMNDGGAVVSQGDLIDLVETKGGGQLPQPLLVDYCDRWIARLILKNDLSTISQKGDAVGSNPQSEKAAKLEAADAKMLTEALNHQVERFVIAYQFGPDAPQLAYLKIKSSTQDDLTQFKREAWKQFATDGTLVDVLANGIDLTALNREVGLPVVEGYKEPWLRITQDGAPVTGMVLKDAEGDVIGAAPAAGAPAAAAKPGETAQAANDSMVKGTEATQATLKDNAVREMARVRQRIEQPIGERVAGILELTDPRAMAVALLKLRADYPQLFAALQKDPSTAQVIAGATGAAAVNGMAAAEVERHTG